jgi:predicted transcriptional regulator
MVTVFKNITIDTARGYSYPQSMQIDLTAEQEAQLAQIAAHEGKGADELAREVFSRGLAAEAHFIAAVKIGQEAASRGDFVEQSEIWADVEQILRP